MTLLDTSFDLRPASASGARPAPASPPLPERTAPTGPGSQAPDASVPGPDEVVVPHECEAPGAALPVVPRPRRSAGVDSARGLAVLGMMVVHILSPTQSDGETPTYAWVLAAGHASVVFAVLAGFGLAVTTRKVDGEAVVSVLTRALLISAIGFLLAPVVGGRALVILPQYGVLFLLAIPLLGMGWRALAALAAALAVVTPLAHHLLRDSTTAPDAVNPHAGQLLSDPAGLVDTLMLTGGYPVVVWCTFLVAGLALGRLPFHSRRVMVGTLVTGVLLAAGTWLVTQVLLDLRGFAALEALGGPDPREVRLFGAEGTVPTTSWWWQLVPGPHTSTLADVLMSLGLALAVIGGLMTHGAAARASARPLALLGSMPLTVYALHLIMLGVWGTDRSGLVTLAVQLAALALFVVVWRRLSPRGPLEGLLRQAAVVTTGLWVTVKHLTGVEHYAPRHARGA